MEQEAGGSEPQTQDAEERTRCLQLSCSLQTSHDVYDHDTHEVTPDA